ncbi:MAG: hypothetical protein ACYC3L_00560 [Gemmatimonadaceae bacterium]
MQAELAELAGQPVGPPDDQLPLGQAVDVTIGRSAADYVGTIRPHADPHGCPPAESGVEPGSERMKTSTSAVPSVFARQLLERIEIASQRLVDESAHLDAVERVAVEYLSAERPWLRLLP